MDLDKTITNPKSILDLIASEFFEYEISDIEKLENGHPLFSYQVNKAALQNGKRYTLFGKPVNNLYAYTRDENSFCLYIAMKIDKVSLDNIIEHFGFPENIEKGDYETGDFDFLAWHWMNLEALLTKDRTGIIQEFGIINAILLITNMKYSESFSSERIF